MSRDGSAGGAGGRAAVRHDIERLGPWFHNLHLPDGLETAPDHPLGDFPAFKWRDVARAIPRHLEGATALDVGCNAGYYSFQLARRGARVLGVDTDARYLRQARWARGRFGFSPGRISFRRAQVYELARWSDRFDVVLFMGLFYHLRYPALALDIVARRTRRLLVFQSLSMPEPCADDRADAGRGRPATRVAGPTVSVAPAGPAEGADEARGGETPTPPGLSDRPLADRAAFLSPAWPKMALVEARFDGDPTNWWIPNRPCVEALLRIAGLEVVDRPHDETYVCVRAARPSRAVSDEAIEAEYRAATGLSRIGPEPVADEA